MVWARVGIPLQEPELAIQHEGRLPVDGGVRHTGHRHRGAVAEQVEVGTVDEDRICDTIR